MVILIFCASHPLLNFIILIIFRHNDRQLSSEVAIKVFKTTLTDFKNREKYVHGDHRFSKDDFKKQNPRRIIKMWAMKETANLNR